MHFLILGGSGRTGKLILDEALSRGHQVTALVRSRSSLQPTDNLTIVEGSPLKVSDIESAFRAVPSSTPSAVVVALNARRATESPFSPPAADTPVRMMADSVGNAIKVMKQHGVRKIVIMSAFGTGNSFDSMNLAFRFIFRHTNMKYQQIDHEAVDAETRVADVDFVLARPAMLAEGEAGEAKVLPDDGKGAGFMPKVNRASVARFMVKALETNEYDRRSPVLMN
ncbi:hypothetical protein JX265_005076 [Neoarthrinium moseri]|uniref:NAD(P)-binding domain-containing protein n=1 Tax=Neoarthrinium moseri TaxID=1658444 RepID=A0A9P9WP70_9PEZI|nr:uncharacterized protein JN550_009200 [Neoarthrinium moseri]KAI1842750.1 hypothetical protein JX266_011071 [Neoarthrinium moseri]KAI1863921.1 hypothetical protein JN550_009200 [Neoarthrinium moseri]KAI1873454.1 hypothetical protein JX265_005076 [Neoarthrinium moseri]